MSFGPGLDELRQQLAAIEGATPEQVAEAAWRLRILNEEMGRLLRSVADAPAPAYHEPVEPMPRFGVVALVAGIE